MCQLWVFNRGDLVFCVRSTPLRDYWFCFGSLYMSAARWVVNGVCLSNTASVGCQLSLSPPPHPPPPPAYTHHTQWSERQTDRQRQRDRERLRQTQRDREFKTWRVLLPQWTTVDRNASTAWANPTLCMECICTEAEGASSFKTSFDKWLGTSDSDTVSSTCHVAQNPLVRTSVKCTCCNANNYYV